MYENSKQKSTIKAFSLFFCILLVHANKCQKVNYSPVGIKPKVA